MAGAVGTTDPLEDLTAIVPRGRAVTSLSDRAYYLIRDRVISLELPPGAAVDEAQLMRELGLGRTPIREGLKRLAHESLVVFIPYRGTFIGDVDVGSLRQISEVRVELEAYAARLGIGRATDEERALARELLEVLERSRGETDRRNLIRIDQRVHHLVYEATHNVYLQGTLERYLNLALRLWCIGLERVGRLREAVDEHRSLLEAMIERDSVRGEQIAREHVAGFEREIRKVL